MIDPKKVKPHSPFTTSGIKGFSNLIHTRSQLEIHMCGRLNNVARTGIEIMIGFSHSQVFSKRSGLLDNTDHDHTQSITLTDKLKITKHERIVTKA